MYKQLSFQTKIFLTNKIINKFSSVFNQYNWKDFYV